MRRDSHGLPIRQGIELDTTTRGVRVLELVFWVAINAVVAVTSINTFGSVGIAVSESRNCWRSAVKDSGEFCHAVLIED